MAVRSGVEVWIGGVGAAPRWLSPDELDRAARFVYAADAEAWTAARDLVRAALSRAHPAIPPRGWQFAYEPGGRPRIVRGPAALRFSVSHTRGQVAVAVGRGADCGVDTEAGVIRDWAGLAPAVLGHGEINALARLPVAQANEAFRRLWTLKEAYAKATGRGLGAWLCDVEFSTTDPVTASACGEPLTHWVFAHRPGEVPVSAAVAAPGVDLVWRDAADLVPT